MSSLEQSTVMGPDRVSHPGTSDNILSPPPLTTDTNMFKWRKKVDLWVTTVKLYAKGGDKKAKGMLSALGITLYKALDDEFSSTIEEAIAAGTLDLEVHNEDAMNPLKQLQVVDKIIELVATDSPTDSIRRLVKMLREVFTCTRKTDETPARFAKRFKSAALDYINHSNGGLSEQDSQNFAMLLVENAKLPPDVYTSITTRLVALVTQQNSMPVKRNYVLPKTRLESMQQILERICISLTTEGELSEESRIASKEDIQDIMLLLENVVNTNKAQEKRDESVFNIRLSDACFVLSDLHIAFPIIAVGYNKEPPNGRSSGALLGKREQLPYDQSQKSTRDKRQKSHIPSGQGPKANSRCRNCKQPHHWFKDPECVYNVIRALMDGRDIEPDVVQKLTPKVKAVFQDGAGGYKKRVSVNDVVSVMEHGTKLHDPSDEKSKEINSYFR